MKEKRRRIFVITVVILVVSYLLVGNGSHGMKQWPIIMLAISGVITLIALGFFYHYGAITASVSYILGYGIGYLFQSNGFDPGGGTTNNLWQIWLISTLVICALGFVIEHFYLKKNKPIIF